MNKLTRYKEIESFLFSQLPMFQRVGAKAFKKDLGNIVKLSKLLGNPENDLNCLHIAGTNGKGSTSFILAAWLGALGYNVGLYTSPHYKSYRERIRVNKEHVTKHFVKSFVNDLIERGLFKSDIKPSFFEITVAMAFGYFKQSDLDYCVIETGLGGRLDSTNIIQPQLSLITNIGFDHTAFLGNTLELIAGEKAGIIKQDTPVIIGTTQKETTAVFKNKASEMNSGISFADKLPRVDFLEDISKSFPSYQYDNIYLAYYGLKALLPKSDMKKLESINLPLELSEWGFMGRYQLLDANPRIILDSAHNAEGMVELMKNISKEAFHELHVVLAMVNDKDISKVLSLLPKKAHYYFSNARIPRALDKQLLKEQASELGLKGKVYTTVPRALAAARKKASSKDLILVAGSIFTVAELV